MTLINTYPFHNRYVRDLAWVIASPPLSTGDELTNKNDVYWWNEVACNKEFQDCLPALLALDKNPEPLITHLAQLKSKRLGLRFESYISYWLKISPNYRQLKQNIQIIKEGHTYGELDFIVEDLHSQKIIHLEVAVKFYLGRLMEDKLSNDPYHWFGTNTNDQFGKKLDHLKQHQTQLTIKHDKHIKKILGFNVDEKQCLLKGRLFYPFGADNPPKGASTNHLRGRWAQQEKSFSNEFFLPIQKEYWLSELDRYEINNLSRQQGLKNLERPQCYVQITNDSSEHHHELERLFYLPDDFWGFK